MSSWKIPQSSVHNPWIVLGKIFTDLSPAVALQANLKLKMGGLHIHIHMHPDKESRDTLNQILQNTIKMGEELNNLTTEVQETKGIMASAKVLIEGFAQKLEAAGTDKAKLTALKDELNAGSEDLAAAISANPLPGEVVNPEPGNGESTPQ